MKKFLLLVVLFFFLYDLFGHFILFTYLITSIKSAIRKEKTYERKNLTLIKIAAAEKESSVEWLEDDEFRLNGSMFDIKEEVLIRDTIYFYCHHDKKEGSLFEWFTRKEHDKNGPHKHKTIKVSLKDYFPNYVSLLIYRSAVTIPELCFEPHIESLIHTVNVPPPELV